MPIFDTIRVNQSHIARIRVARQNMVEEHVNSEDAISGFKKWMDYVKKELKKRQKISTKIEYDL